MEPTQFILHYIVLHIAKYSLLFLALHDAHPARGEQIVFSEPNKSWITSANTVRVQKYDLIQTLSGSCITRVLQNDIETLDKDCPCMNSAVSAMH